MTIQPQMPRARLATLIRVYSLFLLMIRQAMRK